MKIGIAGPINLTLLNVKLDSNEIPSGITNFPFISKIINGILELDHEVVIYTLSRGIEKPMVIRRDNVTICIVPRRSSAGRRFFKSEINELAALMSKYPAEIINAQWTYEYALAALKSGIPNIITIRDHAFTILKFQIDPFRLVRFILNYITFRRAKFFIANSHYLKELINSRHFIKVVPNFYEPEWERYFENQKEIAPKIITVSNGFGNRKNLKTALHAFKIIKDKYPEYEYHIVGRQMSVGSDAHRYAIKHHVGHGVFFRGEIKFNEVLEEVKNSGIYLHPSKEETFGNTVLEAMVVGTPVVGGEKSGNIPYLLDQGNAGVLCNVKDPVSMANGIIKLITNHKLYDEIRIRAKKFTFENYSKDKVMVRLLETYAEVLKSGYNC
jgi:glycosyltransferase involved in cell wall biosynthesis